MSENRKPTVNLTVDNVNNSIWKERTSQKGNRLFYRKYNGRWINVGRYKTGHVYITVDGRLVENHDIKYTNDQQLKDDVDEMLQTLVIIAN